VGDNRVNLSSARGSKGLRQRCKERDLHRRKRKVGEDTLDGSEAAAVILKKSLEANNTPKAPQKKGKLKATQRPAGLHPGD